jgi:hypothetical protein
MADKVDLSIDVNNFFPRYISRPRLIYFMEIDTFFVMLISYIFFFIVFLFTVDSSILTMLLGGICTGFTLYVFTIFKEESASGFIVHYMYNIGLKNPVDNMTKEEKEEIDTLLFIPFGYEDEFSD